MDQILTEEEIQKLGRDFAGELLAEWAAENDFSGEDVTRSLADIDIERQLVRIKKAIEAKLKNADFQEWVVRGLDSHQENMLRALEPLHQEQKIKDFFHNLREELRSVTRDQVPFILDQLENRYNHE